MDNEANGLSGMFQGLIPTLNQPLFQGMQFSYPIITLTLSYAGRYL